MLLNRHYSLSAVGTGMYQAVKFKLIERWNRLLHRLMIKDRRQQTTADKPSYEALSSTLSAIPDLMFELDEYGTHWDARVLRPELLVAPTDQLLGHTVSEVMPKEAAHTVMQALDEAKRLGYSHGSHIHLPTPLGERWFEISIARKEPSHGDPPPEELRFIVLSRDINERKLAHLAAEKLAYHDKLTELPNRYAIKDELLEQLATHQPAGYYSALLFLDLDKFKQINDSRGHHIGDQLLKAVARRLRSTVREEDMLIRWGGDEFIVLMNKLSPNRQEAKQQVTIICQHITRTLSAPYPLESGDFTCQASIGVCLFTHHKHGIERIIQQADAAMYQAKQSQTERYAFDES